MIVIDLECTHGHRFEGWFQSSENYSSQQARGLLICPECGSCQIERRPSAAYVQTGLRPTSPTSLSSPASAPVSSTASSPKTQVTASLKQQLLGWIAEHSEDVGNQFCAEVRRIHYGEADERLIRGKATADECAALHDEGIDVMQLPAIKPERLN